jgi:hypothetical protein
MPGFEWVKERSECSAAKVFEQLRLEVEHDVEIRNAQIAPGAGYRFDVVPKGKKFAVVVAGIKSVGKNVPFYSVTFTLEDGGVSVHDNDNKLALNGTLTLNDDGECRLKVKGKEREFWQFRRMALERLFFEAV